MDLYKLARFLTTRLLVRLGWSCCIKDLMLQTTGQYRHVKNTSLASDIDLCEGRNLWNVTVNSQLNIADPTM